MFFLALAILCSVAIGIIFKYTGQRGVDRVALLTINYFAAVGVALALLVTGGTALDAGITLSPGLLGLSVVVGVLLIAGFFLLSLATELAGMSLALGVWRVSVVLPFLASWLIWAEAPSVWQGFGMLLAGGAFFMIAKQPEPAVPTPAVEPAGSASGADASLPDDSLPDDSEPDEEGLTDQLVDEAPVVASFGVLLLLFLSSGAIDVSLKAFEETFNAGQGEVSLFLLLSFGMAGLVGLVPVVTKGVREQVWPQRNAWGWGIVLGVVNYGSLEFLLRALEYLPGTVVFPINHLAIVLIGALIGVLVFSERLSRINLWGITLATLALALLMM